MKTFTIRSTEPRSAWTFDTLRIGQPFLLEGQNAIRIKTGGDQYLLIDEQAAVALTHSRHGLGNGGATVVIPCNLEITASVQP